MFFVSEWLRSEDRMDDGRMSLVARFSGHNGHSKNEAFKIIDTSRDLV